VRATASDIRGRAELTGNSDTALRRRLVC